MIDHLQLPQRLKCLSQIQQAYDTSQLIITTHFLYRVRLSLANSSRRPARPSSLAASSVCNALCLPLIIRDNNNNNEPLTNNDPPGNGTKRLLILLNHCLIMSDTGDSLLAFNKTPALHFNSAGVMQELVAVSGLLVLPYLDPHCAKRASPSLGKTPWL